jgi:hypothetical protein
VYNAPGLGDFATDILVLGSNQGESREKDGFLRLHAAASDQARHLGLDEGLATNEIVGQAGHCSVKIPSR